MRSCAYFTTNTTCGAWQFHSEQAPDLDDVKLVSLESITEPDPAENEFYQLLLGQSAWRGSVEEEKEWGVVRLD